jgi:hypothetical protein
MRFPLAFPNFIKAKTKLPSRKNIPSTLILLLQRAEMCQRRKKGCFYGVQNEQ